MGFIRPFGAENTVGMQPDNGSFGGLAVGLVEGKTGRIADDVVSAVLVDTLCDPESTGDGIVIPVELERLSGRRSSAVSGGLL